MEDCKHDLKITDEYIFCKKCGKRWYEDRKQIEITPNWMWTPMTYPTYTPMTYPTYTEPITTTWPVTT